MQTLYKEGMAYIDGLAKGGGVVPPSDPTGIDYLTAVDPNLNPAISAVLSIPMQTEVDISTDGAPSGNIFTGTTAPNGVQWGIQGDIYKQLNAAGQVIKFWEKVSCSSNTGWI